MPKRIKGPTSPAWSSLNTLGRYVTTRAEQSGIEVSHDGESWVWNAPLLVFQRSGLFPASAPWTFIAKRHIASSEGFAGDLEHDPQNPGHIIMRNVWFPGLRNHPRAFGKVLRRAAADAPYQAFRAKLLAVALGSSLLGESEECDGA